MSKADEPEEGWTKKDGVWFRDEDLPVILAPDTVELQSMRRNWWIKYKWYAVESVGSNIVTYTKTGLRLIGEHAQAAKDFDEFLKAFKNG